MRKNLLDISANYTDQQCPEGTKDYHGYLPLYEKHLPQSVDKFLEIGVWKGGSLRMFRDCYNNIGEFHALDPNFGTSEMPTEEDFQREGFVTHKAGQADLDFLDKFNERFDVISEDGSHHSDEQVITFREMFLNNLNPGGLYILEDLICCNEEYWWRGKVKSFDDTALGLFRKYLNGEQLTSQYIGEEDNILLMKSIEKIYLYEKESIAFIFKKL